ncbi:MAG: GNAT family N-acetyltransferase [Pseudomonadota bacterium]
MAVTITLHEPAPDALKSALHDGLAAAGQTLAPEEMPEFILTVGDPMQAGCKGEVTFRTLHISELWVDASLRGQGIGSRLLEAAEDLARKKGCIRVHLETRSEGARRLYERMGYRFFGELEQYEGAQSFYYLEKRLDA